MRLSVSKSTWVWWLCAGATLSSAGGADPPASEGLVYFERHIRPLLVRRCYKCHSSAAQKREGGLLLDRRAGWSVGGDRGAAIRPRNVDGSLLIQAVRYSNADLQMPPDQRLSKLEIARLERWVQIGAPAPRGALPAAQDRWDNPSDPVAGREHWAFRPLVQQPPPAAGVSGWPRSPIDSLVLVQLRAAQLQPAPPAPRRALARRVYIQLLGLPPTPRQVRTFVGDQRPDAYERLIDGLLGSPHFGERWGRHWLDLARYADSNGLDENFLFREAWRYRNWVIDAVNADLPFNRFVVEQIAGDLLPHESIEQRDRQRIGAGFLVVGPKVLLGNDAKERRMDIADEQLDTIGRAILGQTFGCARCHDHKFDPVPTADYYALAGILTSTQVMEQRHMLGSQRLMERLAGLGSQGALANGAYELYWRERPQRQEKLKHAQAALELLKKKDAPALAALAKEHAGTVAKGAADTEQTDEDRVNAQQALVAELAAAAEPPAIPPRAMIPRDVEDPADESIRLAGKFDQLGTKVRRGFLRVIGPAPVEIPAGSSGRLELGRWLTDGDGGAGHVAARVFANRVWHHAVGRGIVRTVDNFGRTGEAPTHPELLDHLARELIDSGWSVKELVRKVVLSRTFRMSSRPDDRGQLTDPENRLLWRAHRRRLEPEALRDAMLLVAGELDLAPMESSVWYLGDQATAVGANKNRRRTDFPCRSVYLPVIRNDLPELFEAFDFADPHTTTGMRPETLVATQGLFILNDESVMAAAAAAAQRVVAQRTADASADIVDELFEWVFSEPPTTEERVELMAFVTALKNRSAQRGDQEARLQAWSLACHALFASSRFQILE